MDNLAKLNKLLRNQSVKSRNSNFADILDYVEKIADFENQIAVVSDLKNGNSRIFTGKLALVLGIDNYSHENSIWEKAILDLMTEEERQEKYLAELRFFNFLRHVPHHARPYYYLASKIRMKSTAGEDITVLHRMHYIYDEDNDTLAYALCLYGRCVYDFAGKSMAVNSLTGVTHELTGAGDSSILSNREKQVLKQIDAGKTSAEIAVILSISKYTVSRHRQEILAKLQVRNSVEACRLAKSMGII